MAASIVRSKAVSAGMALLTIGFAVYGAGDSAHGIRQPATLDYGSGSNPLLDIYQRWISPIKGGNTCPMHPSCSQYAKVVFGQTNPAAGLMATCQRIIECGRERDLYPLVAADGIGKSYDPPDVSPKEKEPESRAYVIDTALTRTAARGSCDGAYADKLFGLGEFGLAYGDYLRQALSCGDTALSHAALLRTSECASAVFDAAAYTDYWRRVSAGFAGDTAAVADATVRLARKLCATGDYPRAQASLATLPVSAYSAVRDEYYAQISYIDLRRFRWAGAHRWADSCSPRSRFGDYLSTLSALDTTRLPRRSPLAAGVFSAILPGAGYLYAHRPSTALAALLVNGIFSWAASESFANKNYALGSSICVVAAGLYTGTIRGSAGAARRFNRLQKERLVRSVDCGIFEEPGH